jgi:hypothetical protein
MPIYDVYDEAIIAAPPQLVFKAIIDEYRGASHWFQLHAEYNLRGEKKTIHKDSVIDILIHRPFSPKMTQRITDLIENKLIKVEYFEGDFLGIGEWKFESIDTKTRVGMRWKVKSNRTLFTFLSPFVNIGKIHSETMQQEFKALNRYLNKK